MSLQDLDLNLEDGDFEETGEAFHAVELAQNINPDVFTSLPHTLQSICCYFDSEVQRNVFLISALPVLGSLMPNVRAPHRDGAYSPDYYVAVVAPAGSGKGALSIAARLYLPTHRRMVTDSENELRDFKRREREAKKEGSDFIEPEPLQKSLAISANSSASAFIESLYKNGGSGLVFEQEIDVLANTIQQDWGDYSTYWRKAFHHELLNTNRNGRKIEIARPNLSMVLSGTTSQYFRIVPSAENGTMSRIAPYFFTDRGGWQDQRPTQRSSDLMDMTDLYGERLDTLHLELSKRKKSNGEPNPLWVYLSDAQWDQHESTFAALLKQTRADYSNDYLDSVIKRAGVITLRIASILTILRLHDTGLNMRNLTSAQCEDQDFNTALSIALMHADHALRLSQYLPKQDTKTNGIGRELEAFYKALPKEFKGSEAERVGTEQGISRKTVYRWLKDLKENNLLHTDKAKKAIYKKPK